MKVALLTREYPPEVYGGAGVHVEHLAAELAALDGVDVAVHAFGAERDEPLVAGTYRPWDALTAAADRPHAAALATISVDLAMALAVEGADVVHSHTWYANLAGHLASLLYGVPHVMTAHSLEPLRPWKAEQLGGGYAVSSWCEQVAIESAAAVVAVSAAMRDDVLAAYPAVAPDRVHVIHNGIDPTVYRPTATGDKGGDGPPFALFVGRMTRQKGLDHLLHAARLMRPGHRLVVVAAAPDTPELGAELRSLADDVRAAGVDLVWIEEALPRNDVIDLLTRATVFVCPSVYEPFGIVNAEAMACETAVVASRVGGIPEIVVDGETGVLVDPAGGDFHERLAAAVTALLDDPERARAYGRAGRARVLERFTWTAVARRTAQLYESLVASPA